MAHPKLRQQQMLEWLRTCDERREPFPSDDAIADHFRITAEQARSLLVDLADAKSIALAGAGAERVITLGSKPPAKMTPARAEPPVRTAAALEKARAPKPDRLEMIRAAAAKLQGGKTVPKVKPVVAVASEPEPVPSMPKRQEPRPVPAPVVSPLPAVQPVALPVAPPPAAATRQLNIKVSDEVFDRIAAEASARDIPVGTRARELFTAMMEGAPAPAAPAPVACARKPLVRAEMVAAAQRDGFPLDAFIRLLLERGFQSYRAGAEMAEAAE